MRTLRPLAAALLLLAVPACESNNKGKIVGKWESKDRTPQTQGVTTIIEFNSNSTFHIYVVVPSVHIEKTVTRGNYSLSFGNNVTMSNLNPPLEGKSTSLEEIKIVGNQLSMKGEKGEWITFTKTSDVKPR